MIRDDLNYMKYDIENSPYNIYFISDMHLCHQRIEELADREDNWIGKLISNWNKTVLPTDVVIIVGDACLDVQRYKCCQQYMKTLTGVKILIRGNHDHFERGKLLDNGYFMVLPHLLLRVRRYRESYNIFIHHEPIDENDIIEIKERYDRFIHIHIHGHVHTNQPFAYKRNGIPYFNVSCEVLNYTPISADEIIYIAKKMMKKEIELRTINEIDNLF